MSLVTIKDAFFSASIFGQELNRFSPWTDVNDESQPQKAASSVLARYLTTEDQDCRST